MALKIEMTPYYTIYLAITLLAGMVLMGSSCTVVSKSGKNALPTYMLGAFEDDYGVRYEINNQVFRVLPNDRFHILSVHKDKGFMLLQNDSLNTFAPSKYTRIDYQKLDNMQPYEWAFCYSSYEEDSKKKAKKSVNTRKSDLMTGCNGFPFSRMKGVGVSKKGQ